MMLNWIELPEVDSTNSYVKRMTGQLPDCTLVTARHQSAGRGQRGNVWEAAEGMNFTGSFYKEFSGMPANRQFAISESVALAVRSLLEDYGLDARVKWPNDIYVDDCKVCGILIENSLYGVEVHSSIIGIGLNVNQLVFSDWIPNPASMCGLAGREFSLCEVTERLGKRLSESLSVLPEGMEDVHGEFVRRLWRGEGVWPFRDMRSGEEFVARIEGVRPWGPILLRDGDGGLREYAFKEVRSVLRPGTEMF